MSTTAQVVPFEVGALVKSAVESDLPAVELRVLAQYTVTDRLQRPMYPGGRIVWFYSLNKGKCNVYHEFLRFA